MTPFPITLIGAGALSSLIGARLARSGYAVTLADTWRNAIEMINRSGLVVEDESGRWSAPAQAVFLSDKLQPADVVLVLAKSSGTRAVAGAAARAATSQGLILTLQNGLGNFEVLAEAAGAGRVTVGVAFLGATLLGPGRVRDGGGSRIILQRAERITRAAEALRHAGFEISVEADIVPTQWTKLAANCAVNPLTAILRVPNGALLENVQSRSMLEAAAREVGAVAAALGIRLARDAAEIAVAVARRTAINRSSMLQDVERGAPTEIEALNGAVVREAERLGVAVPVNRHLLAEIRRLSAGPPGVFL
jgi:2-dehydropantoate 2-reductase